MGHPISGSVSALALFAEGEAEHEAHEDDSGEEEDERGVVRMVVEVSDVKKDESDDEIQEAPEDVNDGRGQSFTGRFCKGSGEWFSGDAFDEMRDGVCEERSGEEAGEVGVPGHGGILARAGGLAHAPCFFRWPRGIARGRLCGSKVSPLKPKAGTSGPILRFRIMVSRSKWESHSA